MSADVLYLSTFLFIRIDREQSNLPFSDNRGPLSDNWFDSYFDDVDIGRNM